MGSNKELVIEAGIDKLDEVISFVDSQLENIECSMKAQMQIDIAVEEIFVNIANYAYNPDVGDATIRVEVSDDPLTVTITFLDHGKPYDRTRHTLPSCTGSASSSRADECH